MEWWEIVGLIIAVIGIPSAIYAIRDLIKFLLKYLKNKQAKKYLYDNQTKWKIISPTYSGYVRRVEDLIAVQMIKDWGQQCGIEFEEASGDCIVENGSNFVLICGSKGTTLSRSLDGQNHFHYKILEGDDGKPRIKDTRLSAIDEGVYRSPLDASSNLDTDNQNDLTDYAVIGRYYDRINKVRYIICWGIHGVGSLGGALFLTSNDALIKMLKPYYNHKYGRDFESVVEVRTKRDRLKALGGEILLAPREL